MVITLCSKIITTSRVTSEYQSCRDLFGNLSEVFIKSSSSVYQNLGRIIQEPCLFIHQVSFNKKNNN